jgi:predicted nucleotidyltransferase
MRGPVHQRFAQALDRLVERIKDDRAVLAAILCGSLSHDTVWAHSDIDLVLVTIDDRHVQESELALDADGVNVHASLMPRALFRKTVESAERNSFFHALLAKGTLLYTHDQSIAALCATLGELGDRDTDVRLLRAATRALAPLYKAHKWLLTRSDLDYTALWILYAARPLAEIEVIAARRIADREVLPQALALNPRLFRTIYTGLLNAKKTRRNVEGALQAADRYLARRAPRLFAPVLAHLREVGEARSSRDLEDHFVRNLGVEGVTAACEYLADRGLIGKASAPVNLTKRSTAQVQELAFFHVRG